MQTLLASLAIGMTVRDASAKASLATMRGEVKKTGQDFQSSADTMTRAFVATQQAIAGAARGIVNSVEEAGRKVVAAGAVMTAAVTVPLGLIGGRAKETAGDFEQAMNRVRAALLGADPGQIEALTEAAMRLGPAAGKSAIEAAAGIEALAKSGLSASQILGGALEESLKLSAIGMADLEDASSLTTDVMQQFGKRADELAPVVDRVTGALDVSKLSFNDYRLAIGQTGGVAGGLGYSFEDMNTAIAGTASLFASGSDAGTSFKTFLLSLTPQSKEAAGVIKQLGLEFFEADGRAKPLAAIAEQLNEKLENLSDRSKTEALKTIFGTDAMRTAIGLMNLGADGLERIRTQIDAINAQQKLDIVKEGDIAATQRMAAAWEKVGIVWGNVILPISTAVKSAIAALGNTIAGAPQWFVNLSVGVGLAAASIGPMILITMTLAKVVLPLLLLRMSGVMLGLAALINPIGVLIRLLAQLAMMAGAATLLGAIGARLVAIAAPLGIAISLLTIFISLLGRTTTASEEYLEAQEQANAANQKAIDIQQELATATDKARKAIVEKARADKMAALEALNKAVADAAAAKSAWARVSAEAARMAPNMGAAGAPGSVITSISGRAQNADQLRVNAETAQATLETWLGTLQKLNATIAAGTAPAGGGKVDLTFGGDDSGRTSRGRNAAQDEANYLDELGQLRVGELQALADLTGSIRGRHRAALASLDEERAAYARQLALDEGLTDAKRAELLAAKDAILFQQRAIAEQAMEDDLARDAFEIAKAQNEAAQELLRGQIELADNAKDRRAAELRMLDLQKQLERAQLDLLLATEARGSAAWENARVASESLDQRYATREDRARRENMTPMQSYLDSLEMSANAVGEAIESKAVSAFQRLNQELAQSVTKMIGLTGAAGSFVNTILEGIIEIGIQQNIVKPLANWLYGGSQGTGDSGSSGLLSFINGLFGGSSSRGLSAGESATAASLFDGMSFGGARRAGGRVSPGSWYMVGEEGPEPFVPDVAGTVVPHGGLRRSANDDRPVIVRVAVEEGSLFVPRVTAIAGQVAVETTSTAVGQAARRASQDLSAG